MDEAQAPMGSSSRLHTRGPLPLWWAPSTLHPIYINIRSP